MRSTILLFGAVAGAFAATSALHASAATGLRLYWRLAPPAGATVSLDAGTGHGLVVKAAAMNRRQLVSLSLLGSSRARLHTTVGNPAVGVLRVPGSLQGIRPFAVTFVARIVGPSRVRITRTVIISIRSNRVSLVGPGARSRWAYVLRATDARAKPSARAPIVGPVATATPDGVPNLVRVLVQAQRRGATWVRVALTSIPNSRQGWVRRSTLATYHSVKTRLVIDTERLTLTLYRSGKPVFHAQVGVGRGRWPTPHGSFYIRERLTDFHDSFYGPIAFGTSARSPTLTDWPGGGVVGIHGTNEPHLIPGRISHGCVRLRNADILKLARLLPLGTPLVIR
jgi:hypothetical protein